MARQYGEVVLPDPAPTLASGASTGQDPGTLDRKLSLCRILIACRCASPGATTVTNLSWLQGQKLRRPALRDKLRDEIPPWCGKNHYKHLIHIVCVMGQALLFVSAPANCLGINSSLFWSKVIQLIVRLPEIISLRHEGGKF